MTALTTDHRPLTTAPRVLVVDDDPRMLSMMRRVLEVDGYSVLIAEEGDTALDILRRDSVDLLILDVMMPGHDGFEVCRMVRRESIVPILMLTARDEALDKVTGLDCGADDYVVKPFNPDELLARVRALLRRVQPRQVEALRFQDVEMVPSEREARRNGDLLELTAREYELLELFLRHPRQVLSREQILQDVWGFDYLGDSNLVDVRIKYLRDKLESGGRSRLIQTVRGAGYAPPGLARMLRLGVSLRTRLTLWYGALLAMTLLAFAALLYFTLQRNLSSSMDERLTLRGDQIVREIGPSIGNLLQPEDVAPGQLESTLGAFVQPGIFVQVLSSKGAILAPPPNLFGGELPVPQSSRQAILQDRGIFETISVPVASGDVNVRLLTEPIHQAGTQEVVGAVQVAESLTQFENTMAAVERLLLSAGLGALVLAVVIGWLLTRAALSPVARITETARHIAATGDYRRRLQVQPPRFGHGDELFFLAATFNDMIARLEHVLESQRRLLADTSHELRNPITIIRGNLALLRREGVPESTRREAVIEAEEESARMGRLIGDLLLLARADAGGAPSLKLEPVDLAEVASEVVEQARPRAQDRRLSLAIEGQCVVVGDRGRLRQLITNLVENSIRYTPKNGRIDVRVTGASGTPGVQQRARSARSRRTRAASASTSMALLTVADSGFGISPTDLPHVFERFFRADRARSRAHGGSGLGLSIAEYIVQAHGGSIQAASEGTNRGSVFSVQLPLLADGPPPAAPAEAPAASLEVPLGR